MVNATWKTRLSHTGNRLNWLQYAYLIVFIQVVVFNSDRHNSCNATGTFYKIFINL